MRRYEVFRDPGSVPLTSGGGGWSNPALSGCVHEAAISAVIRNPAYAFDAPSLASGDRVPCSRG